MNCTIYKMLFLVKSTSVPKILDILIWILAFWILHKMLLTSLKHLHENFLLSLMCSWVYWEVLQLIHFLGMYGMSRLELNHTFLRGENGISVNQSEITFRRILRPLILHFAALLLFILIYEPNKLHLLKAI